MSETVLIIGSTGYVGSHVTKAFLLAGYTVRATSRDVKGTEAWLPNIVNNASITIHALDIDAQNGGFACKNALEKLLEGVSVVCFCAGTEKQDESTIKFMSNTVEELVSTTQKVLCVAGASKKPCVIIASSTGSTNKPDADPAEPKSEITAWSDKEKQIANGRFSPAAKTIMETAALNLCGIGTDNSIIDQAVYDASPRLCIVNFSLILGSQLRPGEISAPGLKWFKSICQGQKMNEQIPNDSMSCIHTEDVGKLFVACAKNDKAQHRYFGVNKSFTWERILTEVSHVMKAYELPPKNYEEEAPVTSFDKSRQQELLTGAGVGADLIDLPKMVLDAIQYFEKTDGGFRFGRADGDVGEESGVKWNKDDQQAASKVTRG